MTTFHPGAQPAAPPRSFALRANDNVEVGILGGDIVVRRAGWLVRVLRESWPRWLLGVLLFGERRLPMAPYATVH